MQEADATGANPTAEAFGSNRKQFLTLEFLRLINETRGVDELVSAATVLLQSLSECDAVGIRLRVGQDYPYAATRGFPPEFVRAERELCERDATGRPRLDEGGNPILECMCGNVLCGRYDPSQPFFTQRGSFWTNSTTQLLAQAAKAEGQLRTRNRCNGAGYESVALIPLLANDRRVGLIQFNARHTGRFTEESIRSLESLADQLGVALVKAQTEDSLAKSEQLYRSLFDNMLNGFAYCEMHFDGDTPVDFTYLETNAAFEKLTGLKHVNGRRVSEVIPGLRESDPAIFEIYGRVARCGIPETFESHVTALGMWFSVSVYSPTRDHFVAVFDVITARKRAEQQLRESEQRYRMLIENLEDVVYVVDRNARITFVSESVSRYGYRPDELVGKTFEPFVHPEDLPKATLLLSNPEAQGTARAEFRVFGKSGDVFVVTGSARGLFRDEELSGVIGVVSDITVQKQMEQQLFRSQRMEAIGRLAGGIAHDFNNLLTVINSYTIIISERIPEQEDIHHDLDEISKATVRAAKLTRQLLAFSKRQVLEPQILNLNDIVRDIGTMLQRVVGSEIELVTQLFPHLGNTKVDAGQFEQVLMNLTVNARDAMPQGGTLSIETWNQAVSDAELGRYGLAHAGPYVVLSVTDTGMGMDEATQARAFEPFFSTKESSKGTGLGLATVYGIVRQSDGGIVLTSIPGVGTSFRLLLPQAEGPMGVRLPSIHTPAHRTT